MSDQTTETVGEPEPTQAVVTPVQEEPFDAERARALIEKLRGEVKELKPQAKKAAELEAAEAKRKEAEMSEADRLAKQLADAQAELKNLRLTALKQVAAEKAGLPLQLASRLQGETPEELDADAKQLAETLPKPQSKPPAIPPTLPGAAAHEGRTDQQIMEEVFGRPVNPFDKDYQKRIGGGVFFDQPKE